MYMDAARVVLAFATLDGLELRAIKVFKYISR